MMAAAELVYLMTGIAIFTLGLRGALLHRALLGRIIAINICGAGVFMIFIALAWRGPQQPADAVPHALVLTGIVVAVSATALALALVRRQQDPVDE